MRPAHHPHRLCLGAPLSLYRVRTPNGQVHHACALDRATYITACTRRVLLAGITITTQDPTCPECDTARSVRQLIDPREEHA